MNGLTFEMDRIMVTLFVFSLLRFIQTKLLQSPEVSRVHPDKPTLTEDESDVPPKNRYCLIRIIHIDFRMGLKWASRSILKEKTELFHRLPLPLLSMLEKLLHIFVSFCSIFHLSEILWGLRLAVSRSSLRLKGENSGQEKKKLKY